jgi:glutaredoxin
MAVLNLQGGYKKMNVKIYGADWCKDTQHTISHLKDLGVAFDYINLERDGKAAEWVRKQNEGKERIPTLDIAGQVLSVPNNRALESALREKGFMA